MAQKDVALRNGVPAYTVHSSKSCFWTLFNYVYYYYFDIAIRFSREPSSLVYAHSTDILFFLAIASISSHVMNAVVLRNVPFCGFSLSAGARTTAEDVLEIAVSMAAAALQ